MARSASIRRAGAAEAARSATSRSRVARPSAAWASRAGREASARSARVRPCGVWTSASAASVQTKGGDVRLHDAMSVSGVRASHRARASRSPVPVHGQGGELQQRSRCRHDTDATQLGPCRQSRRGLDPEVRARADPPRDGGVRPRRDLVGSKSAKTRCDERGASRRLVGGGLRRWSLARCREYGRPPSGGARHRRGDWWPEGRRGTRPRGATPTGTADRDRRWVLAVSHAGRVLRGRGTSSVWRLG